MKSALIKVVNWNLNFVRSVSHFGQKLKLSADPELRPQASNLIGTQGTYL